MYRSIADFTQDWNYERGMTSKVLGNLTDASLGQAVRPGGRTLGRLAWHLVITLVEMPGQAGIKVDGPGQQDPIPATAAEIAARYAETAESFTAAVAAQWTDAELNDDVAMYGQTWKKGVVLHAVMNHEVHHRGQMTVLMRQAGLAVPGIYGPAEEEWAMYGLPKHE